MTGEFAVQFMGATGSDSSMGMSAFPQLFAALQPSARKLSERSFVLST